MLARTATVICLVLLPVALAQAAECVALLHGLGRGANSMEKMARTLETAGYETVNIDYPSRRYPVERLARQVLPGALRRCREAGAAPVHFVTHSLGGILLRYYHKHVGIEEMGRAVMLGPPNQGSQLADIMGRLPGFGIIVGPAGRQLGTGEDDLPARLGAVDFELGVIAGTRAIHPFFTPFVPNPDDGTVSVANTAVEGMCARVVLPVTHFLMMRNDRVIGQTLSFLETGRFSAREAENSLCR